jgi:isoamylase
MPRIDISALKVRRGKPQPVGLHVSAEGTRFTVFSRHATRVWVALFEEVSDTTPCWEFEILAREHRTGDMWSILVENVPHGAYYMYRMEGPYVETAGHRFDATKYLLDPYARAFSGHAYNGTMKSVTVPTDFEWHGSLPPRIPMSETVIYEAHLRGLTRHESSGVQGTPGSYLALIEKLPHLKSLGVTAIELLPVQEFGETLLGRCSLLSGRELTNYWGYSNIGFFAPAGRYAASAVCTEHLEEFREMVHALHEAGIQVYLDVVFNHTSEGNERGPTLSFRGIDNVIYYQVDGEHYRNYSGCGNTFNCNHPLVRDFILDCLRYWVAFMHVDGFRFDLASILGRDQQGVVRSDAPLIERIAEDPVLRNTKLIAEAWDAGGAYQVGSFGNARWAEWNGRFRDDVRRYWRGDAGLRGALATRIAGSADLYQWADRRPEHSINFVTCHDGFTLHDLVRYQQKRNWANGEGNRDGSDDEHSFNCGTEGETDDARSTRCACASRRTSWQPCSFPAACRCCWAGTSSAARSAATTMPIARTTRSPGSTGVWPRPMRSWCALRAKWLLSAAPIQRFAAIAFSWGNAGTTTGTATTISTGSHQTLKPNWTGMPMRRHWHSG